MPMTWLEQRLAEMSQTIERLIQLESQSQAADQVSIGNSIGSLRFLDATDWRDFVETMSVVEDALRDDPAGVYARWTSRRATATATSSRRGPPGAASRRTRWRGGRSGRGRTGATTGARPHGPRRLLPDRPGRAAPRARRAGPLSPCERLRRAAGRTPLLFYVGSIRLITATVTLGVLAQAVASGAGGWGLLPLGGLVLAPARVSRS